MQVFELKGIEAWWVGLNTICFPGKEYYKKQDIVKCLTAFENL